MKRKRSRQRLLKSSDITNWLHRDLSRIDKLLLTLATFDTPRSVADIVERAAAAGFREPKKWNVSQCLKSSDGKAIRLSGGWVLTDAGKHHLVGLGVTTVSPAAQQVAVDLRAHLANIGDQQTHHFVEQAIRCHEHALYRAAIVMSWLGAMDVMQKHVFRHHLSAFNTEAIRVNKKWKSAKSPDDIGKMGEADFLDRIEGLSIIGKNVKAQLKSALDLRNGCGHPNSMKVGANKSAAHLETLLQNVFERF